MIVGEPAQAPVPLRVTAKLERTIRLNRGALALDGLLAAAVAMREGLPPISVEGERVEIEIPVAREPGGRFHLASSGEAIVEQFERSYTHRRIPTREILMLADDSVRAVDTALGRTKSFRIPKEVMRLESDTIRFWCLGDAQPIRELLSWIAYVGAQRGSGNGRVGEWIVEPCEPWEGFPVLREGRPLRPLPRDWPGLTGAPFALAECPLTYPYWEHARDEVLAMPEGIR